MDRLGAMERGKLTVQQRTSGQRYYHLQRWEDGRNVSQYVPAADVPAVEAARCEYEQFQNLADQFVTLSEQMGRQERDSKKNAKRPIRPSDRK